MQAPTPAVPAPSPARPSAPTARRGVPLRVLLVLAALCALAPDASALQQAIQFDGTNDLVTFGAAPSLGATTFTVECWFRRTGTGVTTTTGTGGLTALPLLTKGRAEADGSNKDMNWFLGIGYVTGQAEDSVLVADFEEGTGQTSPGLNHPVVGVTRIQRNVLYHAAATYDGTTWRLYLNGELETTLVVGASRLPQSLSIQHAAVATAITSTGATNGAFAGMIDEPRVWSVARSPSEIQSGMHAELTSGTGLLGRWGFDEGAGVTTANSVAGGVAGTLTNGPVWTLDTPFRTAWSLDLGGANAYVALGDPDAFDLPRFTIECWFRRDGTGVTTSTGTGGVTDAIPLVTKGRGENEVSNVDLNWFLGISNTTGVLAADFEEGAAGPDPSLNHPVLGATPVTSGVWHHAAATYDGTTWRLYLDGVLDGSATIGRPTASASTQPAAIGSALTSAGVAAGYFDGAIDEVRIWSEARDAMQIAMAVDSEIVGPREALVARYGLDEGSARVVANSSGAALPGTITGGAWAWAAGAPFDLVVTPPSPPAAPSDLVVTAPSGGRTQLAWIDHATNESGFEIERSVSGSGGPFTPRATVGADVTTWDDTGVVPLTGYCYRVRATNVAGVSDWTAVACATTPEATRAALDLGGAGAYVTFGDPAALDLPQFTIECWFRRDGAGTTTTTGTGGVTDAIPLVAKGRGESESSNVDLNWFLGISAGSGVLAADFEEGAGGSSPSLNHPVFGVTPVASGGWHHAAASYDGTTWNLYLDGSLEATLAVGQPVASASTQQVALGTGLTSTGVAGGAFDGALDEVRVWDVARTLTEIRGTANAQIDTPTPHLVARWALDEGSGTAIGGSAGTAIAGVLTGSGASWIAPAPFALAYNDPPAPPALVAPTDGHVAHPVSLPLEVTVSDPDGDSLTVRFYGRARGAAPAPDFTLVVLPDAQNYTAEANGGSNAMLRSQTRWIADQRVARRIAYALQIGDLSEHGDNGGNMIEWMRADTAFATLEDPLATGLADGIPYGISIGNHDQTPNGDPNGSTAAYNTWFGVSRFGGRGYYGGHAEANNDDWFELFSAGGMDFIVVSVEAGANTQPHVLAWAESLMLAHPERRAILASHALIGTGNPAAFSSAGQTIYDAVKGAPNLFLMLCGHVAGEGRRVDTDAGHTVYTLLADYQGESNGGHGLLRYLEFSPANDVIRVRTYSPWTGETIADADSSSRFTLAYPMSSAASFALLGTVKVASGATAGLVWPDLAGLTGYDWYVTASDGHVTVTGPTWGFTTAETTPPAVTVVSPNGGETLAVGDAVTLSWNATDAVGVTGVDVRLSRGGPDGPFEVLVSDHPNTGSLDWTVTGPATATAWLQVRAHDAGLNIGTDLSDAGFRIVAGSTSAGDGGVREFAFAAPVPNPLVGGGLLRFALPVAAQVRLAVLDLQGREVAVLADRPYGAGSHELRWDGRSPSGALHSGIYFLELRAGGHRFVRRVALVR